MLIVSLPFIIGIPAVKSGQNILQCKFPNIEGFVYTAMNAFAQAAVTFTSQNMGARRYDNLDRVMRNCLLCACLLYTSRCV